MYRSLLVPLDGSPFAEDALPLARLFGHTLNAKLHLAHVLRPAPDVIFKTPLDDIEWKATLLPRAQEYLKVRADEAREGGVAALTAVLEGDVAPALRAYIEEHGIDLVVLTTHGSGGVRRWWMGSVADGLLRTARTDLLLVRPWDDTAERTPGATRFERVMVPLDGSGTAEAALGPALDLAREFGAQVRAIVVVPKPIELTSVLGVRGVELKGDRHERQVNEADEYLEGVKERYALEGLQGSVIPSPSAAEGIIDAARAWDADLLALSSHGRGGLARVVLGSVADKVIRGTTRPVLVVRPSGDE